MTRNYWIIAALLMLAGRQSAVGQSLLAFDSLNINSGNEWLFINPDLCTKDDVMAVTPNLVSMGITQLGNDSLVAYQKGLAADFILSGEGVYNIPLNNFSALPDHIGSLPDTAINAISCDYQGRVILR